MADDLHPRSSGSEHGGGRGTGSGAGSGGDSGVGETRRLGGDPASEWEERYGFSRVISVGPLVLIAGTTAIDDLGFVIGASPYEQATEIFRKLGHELSRVGLTFADVIRTRMYVTDITRADEVGRAHHEAFADSRPAATMVAVPALIDPRLLVEIEIEAWRGNTPAER